MAYTRTEIDNHISEKGAKNLGNRYFNDLEYLFIEYPDSWIGILEHDRNSGMYIPRIQASDLAHAESWCNMREPIPVPFNVIA